MKIQFAEKIKTRFGDDLREPDMRNPGAFKTITLADICCAALDANLFEGDGKNKIRRWEMIQAITAAEREASLLELSESDVLMIKERLLQSAFSASITGCAIKLLEPPHDKPRLVAKGD